MAHPDDELLWAGGLLLSHWEWRRHVAALCRGSDADRAPRFRRALEGFGAVGSIGDLDDGPEQNPLPESLVRETVLGLLADRIFDRLITHSPFGEYTRHRRHEECGRAVAELWRTGRLQAESLWMFAYEDGGRAYVPRAIEGAHQSIEIANGMWREKYRIITEVYGFSPDSWEARSTPKVEAFWCFERPGAYDAWLEEMKADEGAGAL